MRTVVWATQVFPRGPEDVLGGFLHRLARELPERGWRPVVVAPGADGIPAEEERDGVAVERFRYAPPGRQTIAYTGEMHRAAIRHPLRAVGFLRAFRGAIAAALARHRPDVLHAHWWVPTAVLAGALARRADVPWLVSLHGTDVRLARRVPGIAGVARRAVRDAGRLLPVSDALAGDLARLGVAGPRVEVLPMPADDSVFRPAADGGGGRDRQPLFVVAARLTRQKRVDVAIDGFARFAASRPEARLEIAGDGPERGELERRAASAAPGRVRFLGLLPAAALAERFRAATAVMLTSEAEGYGLTLVEAALCGTPGVAVRSGGLADLVESGVTGLLVPPGDAVALSDALARLAADPDLRDRLGRSARARARPATPPPLADRLAALYALLARA